MMIYITLHARVVVAAAMTRSTAAFAPVVFAASRAIYTRALRTVAEAEALAAVGQIT